MSELDLKSAAEAVTKLNLAWESQKATMDELSAEVKKVGAERPETQAKFEKIEADLIKAQKTAEDAVLAVKRSQRVVTDEKGNEINLDAKADQWAGVVGKETGFSEKSFGAEGMTAYKESFLKLAKKSFNTDFLTDAERKALSVGTDSAGGYFVYPDLSGRIVQKIYETSPVRAYASVQMISTDALEGYYDNDEAGFGWVSELEARTETTTPAVGKWRIPVHEMYAMPKASQKVLDDAVTDLEAWLDGKIADKFSRAENAGFVAGDGSGKPRGFLTYADGTDLTNSVARVKTGVNGAFAAAPNGGDVLISALYGLKAVYRSGATWFMNTATQSTVRKLKDTDGAYIWSPSIAAGQPATLIGYSVATFEDMPDIATGALSIAVGDLRQAYQVVDRMGIRMLRDPYTSKGSVLFYATKRTGGDMINGEAIKLIDFSA